MSDLPLVSVVVPAYQAERFLAETLASALAQDYPALEVIVVDDGSSDTTAEIAQRHPVRLLRRPHRGVSAARNAGIAAAHGELITILDADDLWPTDRISRQVAHMNEHPEHGIVLGLTELFVTPGEQHPPHWPEKLADAPLPAVAGTMIARRAVFELVGGFDESMWLCEDIDWLARVKDAGFAAGALEHVLLRYRIHALNTSRDEPANRDVLLRVMRRSVRRQRRPGAGGASRGAREAGLPDPVESGP